MSTTRSAGASSESRARPGDRCVARVLPASNHTVSTRAAVHGRARWPGDGRIVPAEERTEDAGRPPRRVAETRQHSTSDFVSASCASLACHRAGTAFSNRTPGVAVLLIGYAVELHRLAHPDLQRIGDALPERHDVAWRELEQVARRAASSRGRRHGHREVPQCAPAGAADRPGSARGGCDATSG